MNFLNNNINKKNYNDQSYDNSSNMYGIFNEMQDIIKNYSPFAICIPHNAHLLNLVGQYAVESFDKYSNIICFHTI